LPSQTAGETAPAASPGGSAAHAAAQVTIQAVKYSPETIEIRKDEKVEWVNNDLTPHTVTSQGNDHFDSGSIEPGASWSHTFSQAGTFPYVCTFHQEMKATIIVK
jgi:plastocyanin